VKRWMLSLAERLLLEVAAWLGVAPLTGAAEGMLAREYCEGCQSGYRRSLDAAEGSVRMQLMAMVGGGRGARG
jgi:hypothetical protein